MSQTVIQSHNFPALQATGLATHQVIYELTFEKAEQVPLKSERHVGRNNLTGTAVYDLAPSELWPEQAAIIAKGSIYKKLSTLTLL